MPAPNYPTIRARSKSPSSRALSDAELLASAQRACAHTHGASAVDMAAAAAEARAATAAVGAGSAALASPLQCPRQSEPPPRPSSTISSPPRGGYLRKSGGYHGAWRTVLMAPWPSHPLGTDVVVHV